ncbi:ribonuclease-like 3 [Danio aesculapii]|uniref:ribonuclease-like 3 n=1 Tax=Danio aesculapii TaxID=1142201 RepID=UPI0024C03359|nr:ribonuclease-like 3 [Danio aesculapii]
MEILQSAVIFLLVFSFSLTAAEVPPDVAPRYQKFLRQHVDPDMSVQKCDSEMRERGITAGSGNDCKEINTLIQANKRVIKDVCGKAGTPKNNLFISNQPFPVVTCILKSGERHPRCQYQGKRSTRYIVLGCDKGWPVHYEKGITVVKGGSGYSILNLFKTIVYHAFSVVFQILSGECL